LFLPSEARQSKFAVRIFVKKVRILTKTYRQSEKEVAGSPEAKARQPIRLTSLRTSFKRKIEIKL